MLVATAGHIDHGKTSLVRALTGVETDRLPEERARGISIDLGFAYWSPDKERTLGFVDVPGHERFVRNMLAGVSAVDLALLVVAADDGVMPQTIEHVQILDLLGLERGIAVITKCDRSTAERIAAVRADVRGLLAPTSLARIEVLEVSSSTGLGIPRLAEALAAAALALPLREFGSRNFRLAIDRSFSVSGAGTVVTGTVVDGSLQVGDRVVISPRGTEARVRGLQSGGLTVERVVAGQRSAVNLAGIEVAEANRGDWLLVPEMHAPTSRIEVILRVDPKAALVKHHIPVHLHLGTADVVARVLAPGQAAIPPGGEARVQLLLERPCCAVTGDRFVIRDQAGRHTLGGGWIVDPYVTGDRRNKVQQVAVSSALQARDPSRALGALLALPGHEVDTLHFERCFNLKAEVARELYRNGGAILFDGQIALAASRIEAIGHEVVKTLAAFHRSEPGAGGMTTRDLRKALPGSPSARAYVALQKLFVGKGLIETSGPFVRLRGHVPGLTPADTVLWEKALPFLEGRGMQAFTGRELAAELRMSEAIVRASLFRRRNVGEVWRITEDRFMLRSQISALAAIADKLSREVGKKGFSAAQYRDVIGTGRQLAIQILEFFDNAGVTRRAGDRRWIRPDYELVVGR